MKRYFAPGTATRELLTYTDEMNRPTRLTSEEVDYFHAIAAIAQQVAGTNIGIYAHDHDAYEGMRDALGLYWYSDTLGDQFITIDTYYIHECYRAEVLGRYRLYKESLAETICHELAHHMSTHSHTKRHAALTAQYMAAVKDAQQRKGA